MQCLLCEAEAEKSICNRCYPKFKMVLVKFSRGIRGSYNTKLDKTKVQFDLELEFPGDHRELITWVNEDVKDNAKI